MVGEDYAGQDVSVWMFSTPFDMGTHTVAANGRIGATIPADVPAGVHRIAVYDSAGDLIG